jgi:hypothetical protein
MYVVVDSGTGWVLGFGLTPRKADADLFRRKVCYDGPPLETRRCATALYRRLKALDRSGGIFFFLCRINRKGIAICPKRMPSATIYRRRG